MRTSVKRLLVILMNNLNTKELVNIFERIPIKRSILLTSKTPERLQTKVIKESLKVEQNVEFCQRYVQNKNLHHLLKSEVTFSQDLFLNSVDLMNFVENNDLDLNEFCEMIIYLFETLKVSQIEKLFHTAEDVNNCLKKVNFNKKALTSVSNNENQPLDYEVLFEEKEKELQKKERIISENKEKYQKNLQKIQDNNFLEIQKIKNKFNDEVKQLHERERNLIFRLEMENSERKRVLEKNYELDKRINTLTLEMEKKRILIIADTKFKLQLNTQYKFIQFSEENGLDKILKFVKNKPIDKIWVIREQVSGLFIHKLRNKIDYIQIEHKSLLDIQNLS